MKNTQIASILFHLLSDLWDGFKFFFFKNEENRKMKIVS